MKDEDKKDEKKKITTRIQKIVSQLQCPLTEAELLAFGLQMADSLNTTKHIEAQLQGFKDQIKGKLAEQQGITEKCTALIRDKYEFRNIDCTIVYDYESGIKTTIRDDTRQIIKEAKMTNAEMSELPI